MSDKKNSVCYTSILERISKLDIEIEDFKKKIEDLKTTTSEVCLDEIESEKAILEILRLGCIDSMINDKEPEGDS